MKAKMQIGAYAGPFVAALCVLVSLIIASKMGYSVPLKWMPAIFWTTVVFATIVDMSRYRWSHAGFWVCMSLLLSIHLFGMWVIFDRILLGTHMPTLIMAALALIETCGLLAVLAHRKRHYKIR
jgi:hypothetical protein